MIEFYFITINLSHIDVDSGSMKSFLADELSITLVAEEVIARQDVVYLDVRVDPEIFRKIEEGVQSTTNGNLETVR